MYRLLEFLRSVYVFLLFIILEGSAIYIYANSNSYARAKMLGYTSSFMGSINGAARTVVDYFSLQRVNRDLLDRIAFLEGELADYNSQQSDSTLLTHTIYEEQEGVMYRAARVVSNTINRKHNYMVINRGLQDGIRAGMGVVTPNREMVGVVLECSDRFSVVMSVLNTRFRTSGEVEGSSYAGSVFWGGIDRYHIKMRDLSKYSDVKVGDRITSTSFSQIFPAGVTIGEVVDVEMDQEQISYNLVVELATDVSAVDEVLVVSYNDGAEARVLQDRIDRDFDGEYGEPQ